jgi:ectoine hydroxylase-related dioxygenase (phytanoyl-CoA dioxygenase family)
MEIGAWTKAGEWPSTRDLNGIYREIRELGLESNLAELEAFGFTVIENALTPELTARMRDVAIGVAEQRIGRKLDRERETEHHGVQLAHYLLYKDSAFEQAVLNPKPLALITYLLGRSCRLSSLTSHVKGPGGNGLLLHADAANGLPAPFSSYAHVANCNYALTDYTEEAGSLAMIPGSHHYARQPRGYEQGLAGEARNPHAIPVEVPAGSAIVWHGNTWHGSFPRTIPGLRVNLSTFYCRQYMEPQENLRDHIPGGLLERHGEDSRMATLLGLKAYHGYMDDGPKVMPRESPAGRSWHA